MQMLVSIPVKKSINFSFYLRFDHLGLGFLVLNDNRWYLKEGSAVLANYLEVIIKIIGCLLFNKCVHSGEEIRREIRLRHSNNWKKVI